MKKGFLLFLAAIGCISFAILFSSCGPPLSGKSTTVSREGTYFNSILIEAAVDCKVTVQPGTTPSVQLSGPDNMVKLIKTKIEDSVLHIYTDDHFRIDWSDEVKANIIVPSLASLDMSGAGNTDVMGDVTGANLKLDMSGVGRLVLTSIHVTELIADVSGAGSIKIQSGTVQNAMYELSGTGSIDAFGAQHTVATTNVSGAGSINITALQKLTASISGVGNIRYKGHPVVSSDNSGVGKVTDAN